MTLSACIQAAGNDERAPLQALQENMSQVIGELHAQNELNKQLIQQTLQYVHLTLDLLQPQPESAIYERPAGKNSQRWLNPSLTQKLDIGGTEYEIYFSWVRNGKKSSFDAAERVVYNRK